MTNNKKFDLKERTFNFSKAVIRLIKKLPKDFINEEIGKQLLISSTSIGTNYREADGAESAKDFIHKIGIAKKESKETFYWLGLTREANPQLKEDFDLLISEAHEFTLIFSKMVINAKNKT